MRQSQCSRIGNAAREFAVGVAAGLLTVVVLAVACFALAMMAAGFGAVVYIWMTGVDVTDASIGQATEVIWLVLMALVSGYAIRDAYRFSKRRR